MKKNGKIVVTVLSAFSFLGLAFWGFLYYGDALHYLYYTKSALKEFHVYTAIIILLLSILITIIVLMFKGKKVVSIICSVLLILSIPITLLGSFSYFIVLGIGISNGCSYTEDIANYGKYDGEHQVAFFPEAITEDMTVVDFSYFYQYADIGQRDIYLEVRFEDEKTMDEYLMAAQSDFSENGVITYQNPYNSKYTDIVENQWVRLSSRDGYWAAVIEFGGDEDYKYVDMNYQSITYSYEDLTVIYNYTSLGSDISVGNNPDKQEYYPKYLERFGVEWSFENTFKYKYIEE